MWRTTTVSNYPPWHTLTLCCNSTSATQHISAVQRCIALFDYKLLIKGGKAVILG